MSPRTVRSGRVAKMTYSETDEPDATHHRYLSSGCPTRYLSGTCGGTIWHSKNLLDISNPSLDYM